jgi:hypothetical protein
VQNHVIFRAAVVFGAVAALTSLANASITSIYKTNAAGGGSGNGVADTLFRYSSLANVASNTGATSSSISPSIGDSNYTFIFGDFTQSQTTAGSIYKTLYNAQGRISQIVRYTALSNDPLYNLRTNTGGQVFNMTGFGGSGGWDREDDFFHDGTYFYRNQTVSGGSAGVTRYGSFTDLINATNGTYFNYGNGSSARYGYNDRFFAFEGKFYRTNTGGPGGSVSSFAVYNSFSDLVSGTVAQTINSANWARGDIFIAVPTPGAAALVGLAGLLARRRKV